MLKSYTRVSHALCRAGIGEHQRTLGTAAKTFLAACLTTGALALPVPAPVFAAAPLKTSVRVCNYTPAPGAARCLALRRTDAAAVGHVPGGPARGRTASPDSLGTGGAYDPSYLQSAYNLTGAAATAGTGRTIGIVDAYDDPTAEQDMDAYRARWGLPSCPAGCFRRVDQNGGTAYPTGTSWADEISIDIDMASAICPRCNILLVEASSSYLNDLGTAVNTAVRLGATVVSNSYGGSEWSGETSYDTLYFHHPGVAITASSGDGGYKVEYPAASQYVTAIGGTTLIQTGNSGTRSAAETAWSGAGSGCSLYEPKPAWQSDSGCAKRTVADVSAVADPNTGVWVYYKGQWLIYGGTSVAAPIIAAVYALTGVTSPSPSSLPYADPRALNDVVAGNNGVCNPGALYLCTAGIGYDGPTGLGTPNALAAFRPSPSRSPVSQSPPGQPPGRP